MTSLFNNVSWERTGNGVQAEIARPSLNPAISRSYANGLVKKLMHDVVLLSAIFGDGDTISFGKCAEISIFEENSSKFYGFYMSNARDSSPNYCLRHFTWNGDSRNFYTLLSGISSITLFFSSHNFKGSYKEIIEELDSINVDMETEEKIPEPHEKLDLRNSRINYYIANQNMTSMCNYRAGLVKNISAERLFYNLKKLYDFLLLDKTTNINPNSVKIHYLNDCYSGVFNRPMFIDLIKN